MNTNSVVGLGFRLWISDTCKFDFYVVCYSCTAPAFSFEWNTEIPDDLTKYNASLIIKHFLLDPCVETLTLLMKPVSTSFSSHRTWKSCATAGLPTVIDFKFLIDLSPWLDLSLPTLFWSATNCSTFRMLLLPKKGFLVSWASELESVSHVHS